MGGREGDGVNRVDVALVRHSAVDDAAANLKLDTLSNNVVQMSQSHHGGGGVDSSSRCVVSHIVGG